MLGKIWEKSIKKVVEGHWYIKYNDMVELLMSKEREDSPKMLNMNQIATYLNKEGWVYNKRNDNTEIWIRGNKC